MLGHAGAERPLPTSFAPSTVEYVADWLAAARSLHNSLTHLSRCYDQHTNALAVPAAAFHTGSGMVLQAPLENCLAIVLVPCQA